MGIMQTQGGVRAQTEALPFTVTNLGDANGSALAGGAGDAFVAPYAGSIIALSVRHNADLTGGVINWKATINGTANDNLSVVTDDTNQQAFDSCEAHVIPFDAGDYIGLAYTKTGTVAPTTTEVAAMVRVVYHNVDM